MSFTSVLGKVGTIFKDFFTIALPVAKAAEPYIDVAFPGMATLYNLTVTLVTNAEGAAAAAGAQSGSGAQKLALVLASLQPYVVQQQQALGISNPTIAQTTAYINAVVAAWNAYQAVTAVPAPTPAPVIPPTVTTVGGSQMTVTETK